jgi:hypothetical protein
MTDLPNRRWDLGEFENPGDWAAGLRDFVGTPGMLDFVRSLRRFGSALDSIVTRESNDAGSGEETSEGETPRPSAFAGGSQALPIETPPPPAIQPSAAPIETEAEPSVKQASGGAVATEEQVVVVHPVSCLFRPLFVAFC